MQTRILRCKSVSHFPIFKIVKIWKKTCFTLIFVSKDVSCWSPWKPSRKYLGHKYLWALSPSEKAFLDLFCFLLSWCACSRNNDACFIDPRRNLPWCFILCLRWNRLSSEHIMTLSLVSHRYLSYFICLVLITPPVIAFSLLCENKPNTIT